MHNRFFRATFLIAGFFFLPFLAHADIEISEVAWMGTSGSQYEEWIELYNSGSSTSLDGWKIYKAGGGTTLISLSGTISAGQYFLVCRTTPSVPNPLSGACDVAGGFGGSGLNNSSEHILLKDGGGATIDEINASSGWPAGSSTTKETMQRNDSGWVTAAGTPGSANASSGSGGGNNSEEETNDEEEETSEEGVSAEDEIASTKIYSTRIMRVESQKTAIVGSPAHFKAQALDYDRSDLFKGHYSWNMGDGMIREFALGYRETNDGFDYIYDYPGSYTVSVKYFTGFLKDVPAELEQQFTVEVVLATVAISKVYPDGGIELKNTSGNSIDLSGWQIKDAAGAVFLVPEATYLGAGKTVVFSKKVTKLNALGSISVLTPANTFVFSWPVKTVYSGPSKKSAAVEAKEEITKPLGEVLGAEDSPKDEPQEKSGNSGTVWILLFVILILVAVIAVMLLRKVEKTEDSYELLDE